jgi:hypothetical protein
MYEASVFAAHSIVVRKSPSSWSSRVPMRDCASVTTAVYQCGVRQEPDNLLTEANERRRGVI